MEASYDEDLSENLFLQVLRRDYAAVFERAVARGWIVCVPRCGSFAISALAEDDFLGHILVPEEESANFRTLTGKEVKVSNRAITVDYDRCAHLLFEETFYTDRQSKYSLWCIERPLGPSVSDVPEITNLGDSLEHVRTFDKNIMKEMDMAICEFAESHADLEKESLRSQRDLIGALYAKNLRTLLQDTRLREKTVANRHYLRTMKIAAETYMLHGLRNLLPRSISASTANEDAALNKTIKNLHDLQLRDLGVRSDIYDGILRGKLELSRLDVYSTVLGKIGCLKKVINYITEGVTLVSSDDILPVLIFLVIRAGLPNWIAQLAFMKEFRFSVNSSNEADDFLLTSLEAAVEHVRSLRTARPDSQAIETFSIECNPSLSNFFASVRKCDLTKIESILVHDNGKLSNSLKLCHPLCSCETCEERPAAAAAGVSLSPSVHSRDDRGMTAIHVASLFGHVNLVDYLLEHGANKDDSDADGSTPLHCAASRGHQNTLLLLLHANADPTIADSRGNTPLHLAADHGHDACVKALIYFTEQTGIRINKSPVNGNGETPLHHAAKWGYGNIVEILVEHGANTRATNRQGQTPVVVAHSSRVAKLLEEIIPDGQPRRIVRNFFARTNNETGARTSLVNAERLLAAIAANDVRLACYYLGLEGPHQSVPNLCHPLCNCESCATRIEESRRERNTSLNVVANERKETALHVACDHGRTELARILLDAGASVHFTTIDGRTPLHLACLGGFLKIVKLLLNCGNCDVNAEDAFGDTPLHLVARNGNTRIVKLLVRYGADTGIRNSRGKIPLEEVENSKDTFVGIAKILKTVTNKYH